MSTYQYDPKTGMRREEPASGGNQPPQEISWFWILVGFAVFWPAGIFLLVLKIARESQRAASPKVQQVVRTVPVQVAPLVQSSPVQGKNAGKNSKKMNSTAAVLLSLLGAVLTLVGLTQVLHTGDMIGVWETVRVLWNMFVGLGLCSGGASCFLMGGRLKRRQQRCLKYLAILGQRESIAVQELARITGNKEKRVLEDLNDMLEKGLLPQEAYIDMSQGMLFLSARAAQKQAAEKAPETRTETNIPEKQQEEGYAAILHNIRRANDEIADPELSAKINRLEEISAKIFRIVEEDPKRKKEIATFLDYYLPTTQKLLDAYGDFEAAGVEGENLREAKKRIEQIMDAVVAGFERQLDQLYHSDAMDINSEVQVMETMLKRDGSSVEEDFFGATAVQEKTD